jgi:hypothetical protein
LSTLLKLVAFSKEQPARLLTIYLIEQGIKAEYQYSANEYSHEVMLLESSDQIKAKQLAEEFVINPNNQKYQTAAWQSGETVKLTPDKFFSALYFKHFSHLFGDLFIGNGGGFVTLFVAKNSAHCNACRYWAVVAIIGACTYPFLSSAHRV